MAMTDEMKQMLEVVKKYDSKIVASSYKRYFAPNIPDKILKKVIKYFDSNIAVNNIVAVYDITVFSSCKDGWIFTTDGLYDKFIGKPEYIRYQDIKNIDYDYSTKSYWAVIKFNNGKSDFKLSHSLNSKSDYEDLAKMIYELKAIDEIYGLSDYRESGKIKKNPIPEELKKKCHPIIHSAAVAAGGVGAGLAQAVGTDNAVIVPIQITMITTLGKQVFDLDITEAMAKSIIASAGATIAGRTASQVLVGWMPIIGNAVNTATAAGITELIGWIAVGNFYDRYLADKNKGKIEGMKRGYEMASAEYENKLRQQADMFLKEKENVNIMVEEYEKLLDEYENHIKKLEEEKASCTKILELKGELDSLKALK